jgi:hypothetical protein
VNTAYNLKGFRIWATVTGTDGHDNNFIFAAVGQSPSAHGVPRLTAEYTGGHVGYVYNVSPINPKNTWQTQECFLKQSSGVNVADAQVWMTNGGAATTRYSFVSMDTDNANPYRDLAWHQVQSGVFPVGSGYFLGYDVVYVDDSWCRVMVTSSPTWSEVSQVAEIQIPTAWAAGSITATLRQGEFTSLSGKYLYVVKSDGTAMKIGRFT